MLIFLFLVPLLIGVGGLVFGKGRITVKEFFLQEAVVALIVGVGYAMALSNKSSDVEHWNGVIATKTEDDVGCCHSYCCQTCQSCVSDEKGNQTCSPYCCATCYQHGNDLEWNATTSNGENVFHDTCNSPYSSPPRRWRQISIGEPTSVEHSFTNYIKGNPDSILRRQGLEGKWAGQLPEYPRVYDHYRADKFIGGGKEANDLLAAMNGRLGKKKQVDVIVVVTRSGDREFKEALKEHWLGGKKNDLVVVIGVPQPPAIAWADVVTWSRSDEMGIQIRDRLQALPAFDVPQILGVIESEVDKGFVRRRWSDFDYLKSTIEVTDTVRTVLFVVGILASLIMTFVSYKYDIFNEERRQQYRSYSPNRWRTP